nr:tetratricopeptide repeat protein [Pyrinomonadaceae bacterium]
KRFAEAATAFEQLRSYKPDAKTYNYLGESLLETGKPDEAIDALNTALGYDSEFAKARFNLGRAYLKQGNKDLATMQYEMLRSSKSDWADRLYVLINP